MVLLVGCTPEADPMLKTLDANILSARTNDISRTMDFIFDDRQFEQQDFEEKVSTGLNRWAKYSSEEVNAATTDDAEIVTTLLDQYQNTDIVRQNNDDTFINTDPYFLQEAFWISAIAKRVTDGQFLNLVEYYRLAADNFYPEDDDATPVDSLVAKLHPELSDTQAADLSKALTLFDWTVRNIYLLPERQPSADDIEQQRLNDANDPVAAGVRFTGSQRYPWQSLIMGRGDYVDRAKIFLLLVRESGLPAVMLTSGNEDRPWAVGVVVGDQYFLFDTKLGLPIPNAVPGQIATLDQVIATPELLSTLNLTLEESLADDTKYWVTGEDLATIKVKVYVAPESLSRRMNGLETSLVGKYRLALGAFPSKQLEKLPNVDGVEKQLWDVAFKTHRFREAVREALPKAVADDRLSDRLRWYFQQESYIDNFHPYRTCRVRYFKGDFETLEEDLSRNAVESFQFLTYTEDQIDNLGTDRIMMAIAGLAEIKDPAEFNRRLRSTQQQMRLVRRDVGFFLSQCLFDAGSPGTSANWLETIANKDDVKRWKSGVLYLLGRSYESRKEYDRAIEQFEFEASEQVHGNLIRVRLLKAAIAKAYPSAVENETVDAEAVDAETVESETVDSQPADVETMPEQEIEESATSEKKNEEEPADESSDAATDADEDGDGETNDGGDDGEEKQSDESTTDQPSPADDEQPSEPMTESEAEPMTEPDSDSEPTSDSDSVDQ